MQPVYEAHDGAPDRQHRERCPRVQLRAGRTDVRAFRRGRAGVVNLTRSLAPYLEQRNVTINVLAPGTTISPEAAANYGMTVEEWRAQPSRASYADPEDMAAIVLFMCSPAARMLNGAVIVADAASTQFNWPARSTEDLFDEVQASFARSARLRLRLTFQPARLTLVAARVVDDRLSRLKVITARRSGVYCGHPGSPGVRERNPAAVHVVRHGCGGSDR